MAEEEVVCIAVEMASMDSPDRLSDTAQSSNTTYTATSPGHTSLRSHQLISHEVSSNMQHRCHCRRVWLPISFFPKEPAPPQRASRPGLLRGWSWPWLARQRRCSLCQGLKKANTSVTSSFHVVHEDDLSHNNVGSPIVDLTSSSSLSLAPPLHPPSSLLLPHHCSYSHPDGTVPLLDIRLTSSSNSLEQQCETSLNYGATSATTESKSVKKYLFVPKTGRSSSSRRQLDDCRKLRTAPANHKTASFFYRCYCCCTWWPTHGYSLGRPSPAGKKSTSALPASSANGSHLSPGESAVKLSQSQNSFDVKQSLAKRQKISLTKERRAARTLLIVVLVFVICWLPFFVWYVVKPFCPDCPMDERSYNFILWLGFLNSSLNPVIYTIFNLDFRKAFKKMLTGKRSR
ncbi:hypothetical protein RvY_06404 [Ramazzottius varieornatus]|uniref:G-protein coupled receptors family 1 profile domain-containing protein n=1 Tax=Ramazzottius varieornatus TaxID=947166 RepID=A0A1D1V4T4_RAMVA|nr:hypothetical protein RvY_06404 [Ramazzottius varieornatus]